MRRHTRAVSSLIAGVLLLAWWSPAASQAPPDLGTILARVGERVALYWARAQSVICVETSTVLPIGTNWSPDGMARTVESDLRVEFDEPGEGGALEARVTREVRRINGRAPRERDKKDRSGCTDHNPLSPEPLAFLLPAHRDEYRFTSVRDGSEDGRAALMIDFASTTRTSRPELIEDPGGHDDCFDWKGPVASKGRVWVDANTYDVLRVDRYVVGPVDVRVPLKLQRRYNFGPYVVLDRDDLTMRYKPVAFSEPDERILLPESIQSMTLLRGGLQSIRRTESFSGYRRFLTQGRIVKTPR